MVSPVSKLTFPALVNTLNNFSCILAQICSDSTDALWTTAHSLIAVLRGELSKRNNLTVCTDMMKTSLLFGKQLMTFIKMCSKSLKVLLRPLLWEELNLGQPSPVGGGVRLQHHTSTERCYRCLTIYCSIQDRADVCVRSLHRQKIVRAKQRGVFVSPPLVLLGCK